MRALSTPPRRASALDLCCSAGALTGASAAPQDVHFIQNMLGFCQYPLVPGHEVQPARRSLADVCARVRKGPGSRGAPGGLGCTATRPFAQLICGGLQGEMFGVQSLGFI